MTVEEVYKQAQQLSLPERQELFDLLMSEILPVPPNTVTTRQELIKLLEEGMRSPVSPKTSQDWGDIRRDVRERSARRRGLSIANA
jgi:hypothetical protein